MQFDTNNSAGLPKVDTTINGRLSAPLYVCIMVNSDCNLNCQYCYAQPFIHKQIETDHALNVLRQASEMGVFKVTIEGGEPLLHRDLLRILDCALSLGLETDVVSNGTLITEEYATRFKELADKYSSWTGIQISLDSVDPLINDETRGNGLLVKKGLERLLRKAVPTSIGTVVTHYNSAEIEKIVDEYYPAVKNFHFIRVMPTWKSLPNFKKLAPTKDDYSILYRVHRKFEEMMQRDPELEITLLRDKDDFPDFSETANFPCAAGQTQLIIKPDLTVALCDLSLNVTVGSLKTQTLNEIWTGVTLSKLNSYEVRPCLLSIGTDVSYSVSEQHFPELHTLKMEGERRMNVIRNTIA